MKTSSCQVAIVGGGPSGLAVASGLAKAGVDDVVVLDREASAGGIPRHCGHSPFGLREFHRVLSGPEYTRRLLRQAEDYGARVWTDATVTEIGANGKLILSTNDGMQGLSAEKIVICTGNRETPRSGRLVSGSRPLGIVTTGALQSMVYLKHRLPFKCPLIVGSELVSFSALLTCRHAGIKPVAMIDDNSRVTFWKTAALLPRLLGVRLLLNTALEEIHGQERVDSVTIRDAAGKLVTLACDGVIFSGRFVAESSLIRSSHLELDACSGGPAVDQYGRCSDRDYFACGNLLHPVDTAGWCWAEGMRTAAYISASLGGELTQSDRMLEIESSSPSIKYFTPQRIALPEKLADRNHPGFQIRFNDNLPGRISLRGDSVDLIGRNIRARPERRVLLPLPSGDRLSACSSLSLEFLPA